MTPLLLRPSQVAEEINCCRTKVYSLIHRGLIRSVRVDNSIRVPAAAVAEFVDRLEGEAASASTTVT